MEAELKNRLTATDRWLRLGLMIAFAAVNYFLQFVVWMAAVVQVVLTFVSGSPNKNLLKLGKSLSAFSNQILEYLTFNSETKPYPFTHWPGGDAS